MSNDFMNVGNHPALDFLNTRLIKKDQRVELLQSFADLEHWLASFGVLPYIEDLTHLNDADKSILLAEVLEIRGKFEDMVESLVAGQLPDRLWIDYMNDQLRRHAGYDQLMMNGDKISLKRSYSAKNLAGYFVDQIMQLLTSVEHSRIKKCNGSPCLIYFYDSSRNMSRRWCDVNLCGNRANASNHYHRKKEQKTRA